MNGAPKGALFEALGRPPPDQALEFMAGNRRVVTGSRTLRGAVSCADYPGLRRQEPRLHPGQFRCGTFGAGSSLVRMIQRAY